MMTLTVTCSWLMPSRFAMSCWARIGTFSPAQTVALSARTSAIAAYGSRAAELRNMNSQSTSKVFVPRAGRSGSCESGVKGSSARRRPARIVSSDSPSTGPGFQSTSIRRIASMHCPNVFARTAIPVEIWATCVTPGRARTDALLRRRRGVPFRVGARQTMVGSAPLIWRSIENCLRPVTASRASSRLRGVPTTVKSSSDFRVTSTSRSLSSAAASARSP